MYTKVPSFEDLEICVRQATPILVARMKGGSLTTSVFQDRERQERLRGLMVKRPQVSYLEPDNVERAYPFAPFLKGLLLSETGQWYTCHKHPFSLPWRLWGVTPIWRWNQRTLVNIHPYQVIPRIECLLG